MSVLLFILFGLVVGVVARFLMPGAQPMGMIMTAILGMAGSFVGAPLANLVRGNGLSFDAKDPFNWIAAIVGTVILLFLFRRFGSRP